MELPNFGTPIDSFLPDSTQINSVSLVSEKEDAGLSGFTIHGQTHTSASSINLWANCPHAWIASYLYGRKQPFGAAGKAGILIEEAIVNTIARGWSADKALEYVIAEYNKFTILDNPVRESDQKRAEALPGMFYGALEALSPFGDPEFDPGVKQKRIEITCNGDGWTLPVIGFLDFKYPKIGKIIDLKTTGKMPSEMSDEHKRQGCIYKTACRDYDVSFLYVTGKKAEILPCCPDPAEHRYVMQDIKARLNNQERFLSLGDRKLLAKVVPIITSSYYSDSAITKEIFGV